MKCVCVSSTFFKWGFSCHKPKPQPAPCSQKGMWHQTWIPTTQGSQCGAGFTHFNQRKLWPERGHAMVGKPGRRQKMGASTHVTLTFTQCLRCSISTFINNSNITYLMGLLKESKEIANENLFANLKYHPIQIIKLSWVQFSYFLFFRTLTA